jgi:uncharacterized protein (DUF488 family)
MSSFDLFSIGHSNIPAGRFVEMLRANGVNAIADVRSVPASRFFPWFSAKALQSRLAGEGICYDQFGATLGGRPRDAKLYRDGVVDYEVMAEQPDYRRGIDLLLAASAHRRVCLMCVERNPLDCHRCLLVARTLTEQGLAVGHILHDGSIEAHATTEQRLLAMTGADDDLLLTGHGERLAAAYRRCARAVAYRAKARGAKSVAERQ